MRNVVIGLLPWISTMWICYVVFYKQQMSWMVCVGVMGAGIYILVGLNVIIVLVLRYFYRVR